MTGRHAVNGRDPARDSSPVPGGRTRDRVADAAAVVVGAGSALAGSELTGMPGLTGLAGAGLVVAGVGAPSAWFAAHAVRLRMQLRSEQASRRRAAAMATAQDARIHTLRQRLRELDQAQSAGRDELRTATTGLLATKVELASMRSQLDLARHELGAARQTLVDMREELAAMLHSVSQQPIAPRPVTAQMSDLVLPGAGGADDQRRLILPPEATRGTSRADQFPAAERAAFDAFAETDLDDLTGILSVSAVLQHARRHEAALAAGASAPADTPGTLDGGIADDVDSHPEPVVDPVQALLAEDEDLRSSAA